MSEVIIHGNTNAEDKHDIMKVLDTITYGGEKEINESLPTTLIEPDINVEIEKGHILECHM